MYLHVHNYIFCSDINFVQVEISIGITVLYRFQNVHSYNGGSPHNGLISHLLLLSFSLATSLWTE